MKMYKFESKPGADHWEDIGGGYIEGTGDIVEIETGLVVKRRIRNRKGRALTNKLNGGSGFRGKTPVFFLTSLY